MILSDTDFVTDYQFKMRKMPSLLMQTIDPTKHMKLTFTCISAPLELAADTSNSAPCSILHIRSLYFFKLDTMDRLKTLATVLKFVQATR